MPHTTTTTAMPWACEEDMRRDLRDTMSRLHLSQRDVAYVADLPVSVICTWLQGRGCSSATIFSLARAIAEIKEGRDG